MSIIEFSKERVERLICMTNFLKISCSIQKWNKLINRKFMFFFTATQQLHIQFY
ncbi:hypothetical protein GLOIN_2v1595376 [Rhizophagus irregularis DAOM 181602=DAOM 197198]|uniref:Uncharacterized protein n=1 Tax=Rhizophagus irregularis (strain DAOM 181602 / DAOM 197198 / MUCL 43194) TaxID=747089 RepID=A0A2P4Q4B0_RHIID|nr:hypothetical protein GLOIN_2v1595376 [Rhizophagus irregularis DAOM 181602=DAOM 197198]POG72454.1 hypothetical protein GLOIN_2v1595376 [Rhizophagus irregularis DAOM 181602=DAOM 197198]|eukprot:XP_025179320.1 hypothetical protein GLOIN_2v1595376 [Rhizophagus irregularis DAOM 181602=DAOM 197198]